MASSDVEAIERELKGLSLVAMQSHATKSTEQIALELFELATSKENAGLLAEAGEYYRKAYRLDERVDRRYREQLIKHLPPMEKRKYGGGEQSRWKKLDVSKVKVRKLLASFADAEFEALEEDGEGDGKPNGVSLAVLPDEILLRIMEILVLQDTPSWFKFAMTCKKCSYLGIYDSMAWRKLAQIVYSQQVYRGDQRAIRKTVQKKWGRDWLRMLRERPFLKYRGAYVSTVILQRRGERAEMSNSWTQPFRMITYYRYYRFFPDGTCLKLLTIMEPKKVLPMFNKDWRRHQEAADGEGDTAAREWKRVYEGTYEMDLDGEVVTKSEGAYKDWDFVDRFQITSVGKNGRHLRLEWIEMGYRNREDGEVGQFDLGKEKNFKFVRI